MQEIFMFFDDSGVLHRNAPNRFFVYAGYSFVGCDSKNKAKNRYKTAVSRVRKKRHFLKDEEVKACKLMREDRYELYRTLKNEESVGLTVDIKRVHDSILNNKKSIHRYKDYVLKRLVKDKMEDLIGHGLIDPEQDIKLRICVDEQGTATNGIYNFKESVYEELKIGINNFNYGVFYEPIVFGKLEIAVEYCDSKNNYLIQASDILANRLWVSFKINDRKMKNIPNHMCLKLP